MWEEIFIHLCRTFLFWWSGKSADFNILHSHSKLTSMKSIWTRPKEENVPFSRFKKRKWAFPEGVHLPDTLPVVPAVILSSSPSLMMVNWHRWAFPDFSIPAFEEENEQVQLSLNSNWSSRASQLLKTKKCIFNWLQVIDGVCGQLNTTQNHLLFSKT